MKIQTIIWDWNGTLLNDAFLCRDIMNSILENRGLPIMSPERYQSLFDFPVEKYYSKLGFDYAKDSFESLGTQFIELYEKRRAECRLQSGARALLHHLHKLNIRLAVLSAYRHETLVSLLKEKGLSPYFSDIIGADDHYARGKIDQGLQLMRVLGGTRNDTILIGDTLHDHSVASAMGISSMLVFGGHQSKQRLREGGKLFMNNLSEAKNWLAGNI